MFEYMIQTAPRINEIVPKQKVLNESINLERDAIEAQNIKKTKKQDAFLLGTKEKADNVANSVQLKTFIKWVKSAYKGKLNFPDKFEKDLGKFNGQYILED